MSGKKKLNLTTLVKLGEIFESKGWKITPPEEDELGRYGRFCDILSTLSEEEQDLVLDLTKRFIKLELGEYEDRYVRSLNEIVETHNDFESVENIYFTPLIAPKDIGKSKSATFVFYLLKDINHFIAGFKRKKVSFVEKDGINPLIINTESSMLIAVDDFIGTGETASEALEHLISHVGIDRNRILVVSLATMNVGRSVVEEMGIPLYASIEINRGISDYYQDEELVRCLTVMEGIEAKIKVHRNEKYGYKGSEALISLKRTPNNTFPVFWKQKKERLAPFPR